MDEIDRANEQAEDNRRQALANFDRHRRRRAESLAECLECGEAIPEDRRQAVPGVEYCRTCQEYIEQGGGF